jgi:hypothetical protein
MPTEQPQLVGEVDANLLLIKGVAWSAQRILMAVTLGFLDRNRYFFSFMQLLSYPHKAEWTLFQIHYSENVIAQGIELGTSECVSW